MNTRDTGQLGEDLACEYLVEKGFKILLRNYRITFGEIDIICVKSWGLKELLLGKRDQTIHFVEVKSLSFMSPDFFPEDRVDYRKQEKLKKLAEIWMNQNKFSQNHPYQIDVIAVSITNNQKDIKYFGNVVSGT